MEFRKSCFFSNFNGTSKEEVLKIMSNELLQNQFVSELYYEKILQREKKYPTGILGNIGFAIPHTDPEFVLKDSISIAILKEPVKFQEMSDTENEVPAKIIFMLAFTKGEKHIETLQNIVNLAADTEAIEKLLNNDKEYQYNFLNLYFQ